MQSDEFDALRVQFKSPQIEVESAMEIDTEVLVTLRGMVTEVVDKHNMKSGELVRRQVIWCDEIIRMDEVG